MTAGAGRLEGRVCLITGAANGIGAAIAARCLAEGARVAALDRDEDALGRLATRLEAGDRLAPLSCDVADAGSVEAAVAAAEAALGPVDAVVTAAAVSFGGRIEDTDDARWRTVLDVNVVGTARILRAVVPGMRARRRGAIVTVASQLAVAGGRENISYITSKAAVLGLTRCLAMELAEHGVRANCLLPGAIATDLLERAFARAPDPEAARERSRARHPLGRFGMAEEVAHAAVFLLSDEASFSTGTTLAVDGGWLAA